MKNVKNIFTHQKHNRKGVIDVQFNWIFILITGIVIFMFIIGIVLSQKRNADNQVGISTIKQITTILKGRQQSSDVYSEINFQRTNINFKCESDTDLFSFKIDNSNRVDLPLEIIFAPQDISTSKMLVWSQKFSAGFPVSVFTYITTTDSMLIFYNVTDYGGTGVEVPYIRELYNTLPSNITKKLTKDIDKYSSFKRLKIVCIEGFCPLYSGGSVGQSYISISPSSSLLDHGNVTFHLKGSDPDHGTTLPYLTTAGLYGAIFSDTPEYYRCQMSRAFSQLDVKRTLIETSLTLMFTDIDDDTCKTLILTALNNDIGPMKNNLKLNWDDIKTLSNNIRNLESWNEDLRLKSCPKIY